MEGAFYRARRENEWDIYRTKEGERVQRENERARANERERMIFGKKKKKNTALFGRLFTIGRNVDNII